MAAKSMILRFSRLAAAKSASPSCLSTSRFSACCTRTAPTHLLQATSRRAFTNSTVAQAKKYSQDHEWVELDTDGTTGTIGISTYAANALGDVVYVELPALEADITKGDTIGAVESVKSASDILAPASGKVLETNAMLEEKPGQINKSPEGEAWIARIKVKDTSELDGLMDAEGYKKFTAEDS